MMLFKVFATVLFVSQIYATPVNPTSSEETVVVTTQVPPVQNVDNKGSEKVVVSKESGIREAKSIDNELYKGKISAIEDALLRKLNAKCNMKDVSSCVMLKFVTYMNRLLKKSSLEITDSVEITQTAPVVEEEIKKEELEVDESRGYTDESVFGQLISEKLWSFVKSRSLKWNLLPETDLVLSTTPDEEGNVNMGVALRSSRAVETGKSYC